MESTTAIALTVSLLMTDTRAALEDRAQFPVADRGYIYYVTTAASLPDEREGLKAATKLVVASTSLQPIIERCTPQDVTPTLMRIDLRDLHWDWRNWHKVVEGYPYDVHALPMVLRADWLLVTLADGHQSDAAMRLMFGKIPTTRDEWLSRLGVGSQPEMRFGLVEGDSGVSKQSVRWIENRPIQRGYAWGTRDVLKVEIDSDPLQHLLGDFQHNGEEWIIGVPKVSITTGRRGALQTYALANGQGKLVTRAPVDLVEDATEFRGLREIRASGSCIQCHSKGLNDPTVNELRRLVTAGADVYAYPQANAERIEQFHLGDVTTEIERNREDYAVAVHAVCAMEPQAASFAFKTAIDSHDAAVTPERAAHELETDVESLRLAVAYYSASHVETPARIAGLAHGLAMPRDFFAEHYLTLKQAIQIWSAQ